MQIERSYYPEQSENKLKYVELNCYLNAEKGRCEADVLESPGVN